ncbi:MAG TPA: amidase family protein, partial [Thermodesulfovibrionales bacterium]|nr:amidase family protein [Thermodesulfovibrionales bacterium]
MELHTLRIGELRTLLDRKEVAVKDVVDSVYRRIDAVEDRVRAFVTLTRERALEMASEAQRKIDRNLSMPLLGIPLAIKDNMCTRGIRTTCSSKILSQFVPPYESTVTSRLAEKGYI